MINLSWIMGNIVENVILPENPDPKQTNEFITQIKEQHVTKKGEETEETTEDESTTTNTTTTSCNSSLLTINNNHNHNRHHNTAENNDEGSLNGHNSESEHENEGMPLTDDHNIESSDDEWQKESVFQWNFVENDSNKNDVQKNRLQQLFDKNLNRIYDNHKYECYTNLLRNILLNALQNDYAYDYDSDLVQIESVSMNVCRLIVEYLEIYICKTLIIEHNSYNTFFKVPKAKVHKLRSVIGRAPIKNRIFRDCTKPFVYIGRDALKLCSKRLHSSSRHGKKHKISSKKKRYETKLSVPIKYGIPCYTNNSRKNRIIDSDLCSMWKYIFNVELGINNFKHPICLILPSQTPFFVKKCFMRFVFDTMQSCALCIFDKNLLILSFLNALKINDGNGLMIDISNDLCTITPVLNWRIYQKQMILSTYHTGIRMNEDININFEQRKNLLFNLKCKMAQSRNEYDNFVKQNKFEKKIDPFLYLNGESLFDCTHSNALNKNVKKRDYSIFTFDEFVEKTVFDSNTMTAHTPNGNGKHKEKKYKKLTTKKGKDAKNGFIKGLHELIWQCLNAFNDNKMRQKLAENIVIYGSDENGICTLRNSQNIKDRVLNELQSAKCFEEGMQINVHCLCEHDADIQYLSYLTQCSQFDNYWITKQEYKKNKNIKKLCAQRWDISQSRNQKFNDMLNREFYESLLDSFHHKSISYSPLF